MRALYIVICLNLSFITLKGQEVWTIDRAMQHARENSLMIIQSRFQTQRAEIDLQSVKQQRIPSLSFSSSLSNNIGRTIDPTTNDFTTESNYNQSANINAGVQLFNGGLIHKQVQSARLARQEAELEVAATEEDVLLLVVQQFFQALFTKENMNMASANLQLLQEQESRVRAEVEAGAKPRNDLLEIQAEVALSEQRLIEAENQRDLAILQLKQFLRLPVDEEIDVAIPEADEIQANEIDMLSMSELRNRALAVSPDVQAADVRVENAALGIRISKSRYYPSLSLGGSLSTNFSTARQNAVGTGSVIDNQTVFLNGNPVTVGFETPTYRFEPIPYGTQLNDNWGLGFGLQLSVPIYSQGSISASVQQARINHEASRIQKEQEVQVVTEELEQNIADLKSSYRSYVASGKTLEASTLFFNNIELSYNVGAATSFELINAQNRKEDAETNFLISKYEYLARKRSLQIYLKVDEN